MDKNAEVEKMKMYGIKPVIVEVVENTIKDGVHTSRTLNSEELEQWKREHGYVDTENETESDTDRQTDSDTRESE